MNVEGPHSALRVCLRCGFTYAEFRARGLLGCAACYDHLGDALTTDLLQMHPRLHRRAHARRPDAADGAARTAALRERLSDALRLERYEEAAALRRQLEGLQGDAPSGGAARSSVPGTP